MVGAAHARCGLLQERTGIGWSKRCFDFGEQSSCSAERDRTNPFPELIFVQ